MQRNIRFGLKSHFLAITILCVLVSYWTLLPRRTTVAFADAIAGGNHEAISSLSEDRAFLSNKLRSGDSDAVSYHVNFKQRSLGDVFAGRQSAELSFVDVNGQTVHSVDVEVWRFHVEHAWETTPVFSVHIAQCNFGGNRRHIPKRLKPRFEN